MLGDGWYKGRFSYLDEARVKEIYGDDFLLTAQLLITFGDGTRQMITTDETWKCISSPVLFSNIYDGEVYDAAGKSGTGMRAGSPKVWKRLRFPPCVRLLLRES